MDWKKNCYSALDRAKMFESSGHKSRFKELLSCYGNYPFFTKGLCKCIYLSAWDEEHFCIMVETLTELSLGRETNTEEMQIKGDALAEEQEDDEAQVYRLSMAFLTGQDFLLDPDLKISSKIRYIIERALKAAEIIDQL